MKKKILVRSYFYSVRQVALFVFVVLTIRNGKMRPSKANVHQRWIPMRTSAAIRSDWTNISLLMVGVAPSGDTGDSFHYIYIITIFLYEPKCIECAV